MFRVRVEDRSRGQGAWPDANYLSGPPQIASSPTGRNHVGVILTSKPTLGPVLPIPTVNPRA